MVRRMLGGRAPAAALLIIAITVCMIGCSDNDLKKTASAMNKVSVAVGEVQKLTITLSDQKMIPEDVADKIVTACERISATGKQIDAILKAVTAMDQESRKKIVVLLAEISAEIDPKRLEFIAGIKDPASKQKLEATIAILRASLSSAQVIVATTGG